MEQTRVNPLLAAAVIPGETFRLPSQGLFYTNGELSDDVKNGEVVVSAMTAVDELTFKSPDMLFTGRAVTEVFSRCIPQIKKPHELLSKDVDYLMVCLRMVTYGPTLTLSYKHHCEDAKNHTYDVDLQPIVQKSKPIDPTTMAEVFRVVMPNGQVVKLKPTTIGAIIKLNQDVDVSDTMPSLDELKTSVMAVLVDVIDSVDQIKDKELIQEWIGTVSAGWVRLLTDALTKVGDWGTTTKAITQCRDCGEDMELEFSTNPLSFFS